MIAIILAAGMGRRLKSLTANQTKCMVQVSGERLIDRMINSLLKLNLKKIVIVTGYKSKNLTDHIKNKYGNENFEFIYNHLYETTNNIYSLYLAHKLLEENDSLVLESDLIFDPEILKELIEDANPNLSVIAKFQPWMSGTMLEIDEQKYITKFITKEDLEIHRPQSYYKTVNIHKFSKEFSKCRYIPFLKTYIQVFGKNEFYEQVLGVLSILDRTGLKGYVLDKQKWFEIDDQQDIVTSEVLFSETNNLKKYQDQYGGFWRFPKLLDYCYLVNPYFPTSSFKQEFTRFFDNLLSSYPSGRTTNDQLAANLFDIENDFLCVGNGASELIKVLGDIFSQQTIGIIFPTFEEYPNSIPKNNIVPYFCKEENKFNINAVELINHYENSNISALLIINPNIPTGNLIPKKDIIALLGWAQGKNISIIIDESFLDFSRSSENNSLFNNESLILYSNLVIIKSISKTYGVAGLRLGVMASSNKFLIQQMRNKLPIWNINSFAEHFLQIAPRYEKEYHIACNLLKEERTIMFNKLKEISFLKTYPSEANFFFCEITYGFTSKELAEILLRKFNILIKDCSNKLGLESSQYVRIAIRSSSENDIIFKSLLHLSIDLKMVDNYTNKFA